MAGNEFARLFEEARQTDEYWAADAAYDFTEAIAGLMQAKNISKSELARLIGKTPAYITKILRGDTNFTLDTMVKLARKLDADIQISVIPKAKSIGLGARISKISKTDATLLDFSRLYSSWINPQNTIYLYNVSIPIGAKEQEEEFHEKYRAA